MNEKSFLKTKFREYYLKNRIPLLPRIEQREFGVGDFKKKITSRHLNFPSMNALKDYLVMETPLHISASVAYYGNVKGRTMDEKQWVGTDLIFEFDSDELNPPCMETHDSWRCPKCKKAGHGSVRACPECGSKTLLDSWVCHQCLNAAREQMQKLIDDFLLSDFGFEKKDLSLNFSGNRGYHIYIRNDVVYNLDKSAIVELMNYVTGRNLDPISHGFAEPDFSKSQKTYGPKPTDLGWSGRIARSAIDYIGKADAKSFAVDFNISTQMAHRILDRKEEMVRGIESGLWPLDFVKTKNPLEIWASLAQRFAARSAAEVDAQVTSDVRKIMRLPGSLHGATGLIAMPVKDLDRFDPLKDPIAFKGGSTKINVSRAPEFTLGGETFGPYENKTLELSDFAAVYLIAKGVAVIV
ncbi:MAG: hypothetical protein JXA43_00750 [Candidatus Diapherotrites archaeon]|nr:hypothetical protein [Candidatus Diapherotrites archaeon]